MKSSSVNNNNNNNNNSQQALLRFPVGAIVTPGDRLGSLRSVLPGIGTYARGGHIYASTVGILHLATQQKQQQQTSALDIESGEGRDIYSSMDHDPQHELTVVSVASSKGRPASSQVLGKGQLVLCRVLRIMLQQVAVEVIAGTFLDPFQKCNTFNKPEGIIRREDVKHGTVSAEELFLESCFRPGDWVLGRIVSLGDSRRYLISTAEPELGVVRAFSSWNQQHASRQQLQQTAMQPISFKEMKCPVTGKTEVRKVAKVSAETIAQVLMGSHKSRTT